MMDENDDSAEFYVPPPEPGLTKDESAEFYVPPPEPGLTNFRLNTGSGAQCPTGFLPLTAARYSLPLNTDTLSEVFLAITNENIAEISVGNAASPLVDMDELLNHAEDIVNIVVCRNDFPKQNDNNMSFESNTVADEDFNNQFGSYSHLAVSSDFRSTKYNMETRPGNFFGDTARSETPCKKNVAVIESTLVSSPAEICTRHGTPVMASNSGHRNVEQESEETIKPVNEVQKQYRRASHARTYQELEDRAVRCRRPDCCSYKYHCPLCPVDVIKPMARSKLLRHMKGHWNIRVVFNDLSIVRCGRRCEEMIEGSSHWHCPLCNFINSRRSYFINHLNNLHNGILHRALSKRTINRMNKDKQQVSSRFIMTSGADSASPLHLRQQAETLVKHCCTNYNLTYRTHDHTYILEGQPNQLKKVKHFLQSELEKTQKRNSTSSDTTESMRCFITDDSTNSAEDKTVTIIIEQANSSDKLNERLVSQTTKTKYWTCQICSEKFVSYKELLKHNKSVHQRVFPSRQVAPCEICGKSMQIKHMKTHISTIHNALKDYLCHLCKRNFATRFTLNCHLETHQNEKDRKRKYTCSFCSKSFYRHQALKEHLNIHTGEKPYQCSACEKVFSTRSIATTHLKTHNDTVYTCPICNKIFTREKYLNEHVRHHPWGKYTCSLCRREFTQRNLPGEKHECETCAQQSFTCGHCSERFPALIQVQNHIQDAHMQDIIHVQDDHMQDDHMQDAHMQGEHMQDAHMQGDHMQDAHMQGAHMQDAHMQDAHMQGDHMHKVDSIGKQKVLVLENEIQENRQIIDFPAEIITS